MYRFILHSRTNYNFVQKKALLLLHQKQSKCVYKSITELKLPIGFSHGYHTSRSNNKLPSDVIESYWNDIKKRVSSPNGLREECGHEHLDKDDVEGASVQSLIKYALLIRKDPPSDILPHVVTRDLMDFYYSCNLQQKENFFKVLSAEFGVDRVELDKAIESFKQDSNDDDENYIRTRIHKEENLRRAATPLYRSLISQFCTLSGGVEFVVNMRADMLKILRNKKELTELKELEGVVKNMLLEMFSVGRLDLEQITWTSPATILEQIHVHEAVHSYQDWQDVKRRVGPDRRVYAFFHQSMSYIPLVVVHTALVENISNNVQELLKPFDKALEPSKVTTAVFYSISSTQPGLSGAELGTFLIKRVVRELLPSFPRLNTFVTLSPIPGFRKWLFTRVRVELSNDNFLVPLLSKAELQEISLIVKDERLNSFLTFKNDEPLQSFHDLLETKSWWTKESLSTPLTADKSNTPEKILKPIMERLCARYLCVERKKKAAIDPVANFHIRNGASVYRLNWMGDTSEKGMTNSFGLMVNYRYELDKVENNNENYLINGVISMSPSLEAYL